MKKLTFSLAMFLLLASQASAAFMLLPMDEEQKNHLKAYGVAYWILENKVEAWWLLNYRGGSFAFPHTTLFEKECLTRGVSFEIIPDAAFNGILNEIAQPEVNMDAVKLEKAPKIAVYTPNEGFMTERGDNIQPWDDAVTLVLTYAEIPYDKIYDDEVLADRLTEYDWLHLHHEDFTGQYGKFYSGYHAQPWYRENQRLSEELARKHGFNKVSQLKLAVAKRIKEYVVGGGFMFAMCSATDTYDIALSAEGVDICDKYYDGDGPDPNAQGKLDYGKTFAFTNFELVKNPLEYEHSTIDSHYGRNIDPEQDYFTLFDFSAKWDPVPTMLTQCQTRTVKGFMGQATAFRKSTIKPNVLVMGENKPMQEARYIHSPYGQGFFTFYGGHDP
ncbi:MAG: asparagine synthetase B, partial [Bacteroidota bacterium]